MTLRFQNPDEERAFVVDHDEGALSQQKACGVAAIVFYAAFGVLDALVVDDGLAQLLLVRFAVVCGIALAMTVFWRPWAALVAQPVVCAVVIVAAFALNGMLFLAPLPSDYSRTGTLLILMFLFAFARVRFVWAIATAPVVAGGYGVFAAIENTSFDEDVYNIFVLTAFILIGASTSYTLERLRRLEYYRRQQLAVERQRSDDLLHNMLPQPIAARLRENPASIAESADEASVLFADIVGFTPLSMHLPPEQVVELLDMLFNRFDDLCDQRAVEKIKTIGDAYMAVSGIPLPNPDHAGTLVELAFDMQRTAAEVSPLWPSPLALRIGIASGPVVAGVIGHRKFAYDLWGDTVNTASRMESHGRPNRIQVCEPTYERLRDRYVFGEPQTTNIKGKGPMVTYFLLGPGAH